MTYSVNRYTIQASEDINLYDAVLTMKFKILDRQGTRLSKTTLVLFKLTGLNLEDNRDNTVYELNIY